MSIKPLAAMVLCMLGAALVVPVQAAGRTRDKSTDAASASVSRQISQMQKQIRALQEQLEKLKQSQATAAAQRKKDAEQEKARDKKVAELAKAGSKSKQGIQFGGAMRFQYFTGDYNKAIQHRNGDAAFDIFRINMRGKVDNIELQAEWRWFQYMSAIKYAWLGYDFTPDQQLQVGLTRIPFGNQPYNSHNYFFSSNYYLGLEDTYHMGVEYVYSGSPWNVQLAFFKNDGMGGVGGYVTSPNRSYSYDVVGVRGPNEGIYAAPQTPAGSINTAAARVAYTFKPAADLKVQVGASGLHGGVQGTTSRIGHYAAYALHMDAFYKRLNVQAQAARYDYSINGGADRLAVGAYAFYDSIPAKADSYSFNLKYHQPVQWGPIHGLDFYNDYTIITNKSGLLADTFMNVTGVAVGAGDLYTYVDFVTGRNQPFIGGSMVGDGKIRHRFNINFGFYF